MADEGPRDLLASSRTLLANERTFAAWIRTGLAVAGTGLAVARAAPEAERRGVATLLGAIFVVLGVALLFVGAHRYTRVKADLREGVERAVVLRGWTTYLLVALAAALLFGSLLVLRAR